MGRAQLGSMRLRIYEAEAAVQAEHVVQVFNGVLSCFASLMVPVEIEGAGERTNRLNIGGGLECLWNLNSAFLCNKTDHQNVL